MEAPCSYGVCRKGELCPHVEEVALTTDHSRVPRKSEGGMASMDVITARGTANRALAGLGKRRDGGSGSPSPVVKERAGASDGRRVQSTFWTIDVTLS